MSERTYLITGALGCIGAWVVERLLEKGDCPVVFDLGTEPRRIRDLLGATALDRVSFVQGDIADPAALGACILSGVACLSLAPHQEPRFLLPLTLPLALLFGSSVCATEPAAPGRVRPGPDAPRAFGWRGAWGLSCRWLLFNLAMLLFFAGAHQSGVTRVLIWLAGRGGGDEGFAGGLTRGDAVSHGRALAQILRDAGQQVPPELEQLGSRGGKGGKGGRGKGGRRPKGGGGGRGGGWGKGRGGGGGSSWGGGSKWGGSKW